jgi:glycerol kinase
VIFVPAFTGLGAPYWSPDVRGAIFGLTRATTIAHITRAALEAQAFQTCDLMGAMIADSGVTPSVLRVDGGLVQNEMMVQFLADMLNMQVEIPHSVETTAMGAAYLAGLGAGVFKNLDDITANWKKDKSYTPTLSQEKRDEFYAGWKHAVKQLL